VGEKEGCRSFRLEKGTVFQRSMWKKTGFVATRGPVDKPRFVREKGGKKKRLSGSKETTCFQRGCIAERKEETLAPDGEPLGYRQSKCVAEEGKRSDLFSLRRGEKEPPLLDPI